MINREKKYIFVHVAKCAGTSIQRTLTGKREGHSTMREYYVESIRDGWDLDKFYKWAIVRNPWDRILSAYLSTRKLSKNEKDDRFAEPIVMGFSSFIELLYGRIDDFNDLTDIKWRNHLEEGEDSFLSIDSLPKLIHYMPALPCLTVRGEYRMDFVGKFENLQADWKHALKTTGVKIKGGLTWGNRTESGVVKHEKVQKKSEKKTMSDMYPAPAYMKQSQTVVKREKIPYREYYDDDTINMVGELYKRDIDKFSYSF